MMGAEPFTRALEAGAEVVIAGRSRDPSMFAANPLQRGLPPGPAWHAAKILECGAAGVAYRTRGPDCMFARIGRDGFVMVPPHPEYACTPVSIAAHTFYETGSPTHLPEPGGTLDTGGTAYEALDPRTVRVTGSAFRPAPRYTVKLVGAEGLGHQSLLPRLRHGTGSGGGLPRRRRARHQGHHSAAGGAGRPAGGRSARRPAVLRPRRAGDSLT